MALETGFYGKAISMQLVNDIYKVDDGNWTDDLAQWTASTPVAGMLDALTETLGRRFVHEYNKMTVVFEKIMGPRAAKVTPILR